MRYYQLSSSTFFDECPYYLFSFFSAFLGAGLGFYSMMSSSSPYILGASLPFLATTRLSSLFSFSLFSA